MNITNQDFLSSLFGDNAPWVHVTDFFFDPNNIPSEEHLRCWAGDYFSRYQLTPGTNQYFTISNFYADENGKARRRKTLYWQTPVIVLDDVKEKLDLAEVQKLPRPTYILETSPGSEQWGYLLDQPCTERARVENLLDGLVSNGLAPQGKDPGMKGVTRYVRLPEGYNTKASKLVNGQPFKCRMLLWEPFNRVSMEQLAEPFNIDLNAQRREGRIDGADDVSDHPMLHLPAHVIDIKEVRSAGRFDITCPWVDEHTRGADDGAAMFTNADGTIGFKCHHGSCEGRTGGDLLKHIEEFQPGFGAELKHWQTVRSFNTLSETKATNVPDFTQPIQAKVIPESQPPQPPAQQDTKQTEIQLTEGALDSLRRQLPGTIEQRRQASELLKIVESYDQIERVHWHQQIKDAMRWNNKEFNLIVDDLRAQWYESSHSEDNFYGGLVYIAELDKFYDQRKRIFYTPQAFQNSFAHLNPEARKDALEGRVTKADRLDYAPGKPAIFESRGVTFSNSWQEIDTDVGTPGDVSRWLDHWDALGWTQDRDHMLQWMAYTILHPGKKINHMLLLGGAEGIGKDFLLEPLKVAMEGNHVTIDGDVLMGDHNEHLLGCKYLHINEIELSNHREADSVGKKIKPLAAAPPRTLRVNPKGVTAFQVRNIVNSTMGTNSTLPFKTHELSRRLYGVWSDLSIRNETGDITAEWKAYWTDRWEWMNNGGAQNCIHYLRTHVDISNFNPAAPPIMTEFVRHIYESSKSSLAQTIDMLARHYAGSFKMDIVNVMDVLMTIHSGEEAHDQQMFIDSRYVTPMKILNTLLTMKQYKMRIVNTPEGMRRFWIIRNSERYSPMGDDDFLREHERQSRMGQGGSAHLFKGAVDNVRAIKCF